MQVMELLWNRFPESRCNHAESALGDMGVVLIVEKADVTLLRFHAQVFAARRYQESEQNCKVAFAAVTGAVQDGGLTFLEVGPKPVFGRA